MAERRMFTKKITESDAFLDMPASTQALYFHLNMHADDDGFVNSPKSIQRTVGASVDDLKLLLAKKFIIAFDSGVIVIKHWKMHNYIQSDRYKPSDYVDEKSLLTLDNKKAYSITENGMYTECIQNVSIGKDRLGKDRLGKDRLGNNIVEQSIDNTSSDINDIVDYLNMVCGTNYKATTEKTRRLINTRLKEFSIADFHTVIDKKAMEWLGTDMEKYLRPETLFGTKFESYLNQNVATQNNKKGERDILQELFDA